MDKLNDDEKTAAPRILKDGERIRVPMVMMDSAPRHSIHDGMGNAAGHKPGFVFSADAAALATREAARSEYLAYLKDAWRGGSRPDDAPFDLENAWRKP